MDDDAVPDFVRATEAAHSAFVRDVFRRLETRAQTDFCSQHDG